MAKQLVVFSEVDAWKLEALRAQARLIERSQLDLQAEANKVLAAYGLPQDSIPAIVMQAGQQVPQFTAIGRDGRPCVREVPDEAPSAAQEVKPS